MSHAVEKVRSTGNQQVMVTERGSCFGYQNLVDEADWRTQGQEVMPEGGRA